jgi:hypothetical protein
MRGRHWTAAHLPDANGRHLDCAVIGILIRLPALFTRKISISMLSAISSSTSTGSCRSCSARATGPTAVSSSAAQQHLPRCCFDGSSSSSRCNSRGTTCSSYLGNRPAACRGLSCQIVTMHWRAAAASRCSATVSTAGRCCPAAGPSSTSCNSSTRAAGGRHCRALLLSWCSTRRLSSWL